MLHNITNTHLHKRPRVLNLHTRESAIYSPNKYLNRKSIKRYIPSNPERVLDAPELKDDFYLNLIDWSSDNIISAPLLDELYLWNETDRKTTLLIKRNPEDLNGYLASTSWMKTKSKFSLNRFILVCFFTVFFYFKMIKSQLGFQTAMLICGM